MSYLDDAHYAAHAQRRALRGLPPTPFHPGHVDPAVVARNAETRAFVTQLDTRAPNGADTPQPHPDEEGTR
ncbi:hypothetical protein [Georgenia faecalis]|uniref:hypothetical protein n=1 Tax=Georgenia faecalis TaxID=2483799 RepID=UPI000FD7A4A0|nr:hypothetical protein [Georgenia faecalis]